MSIEGFKVSSVEMEFDIRSYLMRKSKKKDKDCYVLEAIHFSTPKVLRFCFLTNSDAKKYLDFIRGLIDLGYKEEIKRTYNMEVSKSSISRRKNSPCKEKPSTTEAEDSAKERKTE